MKPQIFHISGLTLYSILMILLAQNNFLVFHIIIEFTGLAIGFSLLLFIGLSHRTELPRIAMIIAIGLFFSSLVLILHTLYYGEMNVFSGATGNKAIQFWIVGNLILASSILFGTLSHKFKVNMKWLISIVVFGSTLLVLSIFINIFPACYIVGTGLTTFKIVMEYLIILIYIASGITMFAYKPLEHRNFKFDFLLILILLISSELVFTLYTGLTENIIVIGHLTKVAGLYLLLVAMIMEFFVHPLSKSLTDFSKEIDGLKAAFKETEKNADIFRALYDDAPLGYQSLDESGHFLIVNETYARLLGYEKEEMIGKFFGSFMSENSKTEINENFKAFKERGSVDVIFEMIHKSGHLIPVRFLGKIAYKGDGNFKQTHCILMDISNEVEYQKGIIESRERLENILDLTGEGVYTIDSNGICISINDRAIQLLGYSNRAEFIGKNMHSLIHHSRIDGEEYKEEDCPSRITMESGNDSANLRNIFWKKNGKWIEVVLSTYPLIFDEDVIGATVTFRDKTSSDNIVRSLVDMSYHDTLTGVFNRRYFEEEIKNIDIPKNYPLSIIVADINGLKLVNDAFGHLSGDQLLIHATEVFIHHAKKRDFIARIGGDEFIMVMPNTDQQEAENRVLALIESAKRYYVKSVQLSVSYGVKAKISSFEDFNEIYKSAEDEMYRMKLLDVPSMRSNTIDTIIRTLYEKDVYSETHSRNVSKLSEVIAQKYKLSFQQINEIRMAGILHDIGKIVITKDIISKNGKLTPQEYEEVKKHPEIGFRILNSSNELRQLSEIVLSHHEYWDGSGYPRGLAGEQIPILSRIISVADAFDAMTTERTYRKEISYTEAIEELKRCSGSQFDPNVVKIFETHFDDIIKLSQSKVYD